MKKKLFFIFTVLSFPLCYAMQRDTDAAILDLGKKILELEKSIQEATALKARVERKLQMNLHWKNSLLKKLENPMQPRLHAGALERLERLRKEDKYFKGLADQATSKIQQDSEQKESLIAQQKNLTSSKSQLNEVPYGLLLKKYPILIQSIPKGCEKVLVPFLLKEAGTDSAVLQEANERSGAASQYIWRALNNLYDMGLENYEIEDQGAGYVFFSPKEASGTSTYFKQSEIPQLSSRKFADPFAKETLEHIAGNYKIHLMPHREFIVEIVKKLIHALKHDPSLAALIINFKVLYKPATTETMRVKEMLEGKRMARIVIYPAEGKDKAQKALNKIVDLFKDDVTKGIGIAPRWNQKVNDLVYFAQGDGDYKKLSEYERYFEQPDMIYYEPFFTGNYKDHHLRF